MSDVKRSLLDIGPGKEPEDDDSTEEAVESNETFAEFCSRKAISR